MKDEKLTVIIGTHRPNSNSEMVAQHYLNELKKLEVNFSVLSLKGLAYDFLLR